MVIISVWAQSEALIPHSKAHFNLVKHCSRRSRSFLTTQPDTQKKKEIVPSVKGMPIQEQTHRHN